MRPCGSSAGIFGARRGLSREEVRLHGLESIPVLKDDCQPAYANENLSLGFGADFVSAALGNGTSAPQEELRHALAASRSS